MAPRRLKYSKGVREGILLSTPLRTKRRGNTFRSQRLTVRFFPRDTSLAQRETLPRPLDPVHPLNTLRAS